MNEKITQLIYEATHIRLSAHKVEQIQSEILRRKLSVDDIRPDVVGALPGWLVELATVNETFFFRHAEHFAEVVKFAQAERRHSLQVLSAGCSSGEEIHSLAMTLDASGIRMVADAIDLDEKVVERGRSGLYEEVAIQRVPPEYQAIVNKYTTPIAGLSQTKIQVKPEILAMTNFRCGNLFTVPLKKYDVILCRNILVYFGQEDRRKLLDRLNANLNTPGLLFTGSGELWPGSLFDDIERVSSGAYRKVSYDRRAG